MDSRRLSGLTRSTLVIICGLLLAVTGYAELPPSYYIELQKNAPEYVKIEVINAKKERVENTDTEKNSIDAVTNVELEAKVLEVSRTKSGLKPGDTIHIKYHHTTYRGVRLGPSEIPVLETGNVSPAFLTKSEGKEFYEPAARGKTFTDLLSKKAGK